MSSTLMKSDSDIPLEALSITFDEGSETVFIQLAYGAAIPLQTIKSAACISAIVSRSGRQRSG